MADKKIYAVTEITRLIRSTLESKFGAVWIEGELSNVRCPSSGHYYFTIKDESAQISGVLFKGSQRGLKFKPRDGIVVRVFGEISVYERSGNYQIIVRQMEEGGKGALQAQFEALKKKLYEEGLFDEARKQSIPMLPQHVGVVTSRTGAAVRDILNVVSRRFPNLHVVLSPAKVQGEGAGEEVAAAIDLLNEHGGLDVLIVGRGGGSLEDLWCFNEEVVARAIVRSKIPVISAVGHEIDFAISDFVADMRAPTPSAAAELVVGCKDSFEQKLEVCQQQLVRSLREHVLILKSRFSEVAGSYVFREPRNIVKQYLQRIDGLEVRIVRAIESSVADGRQELEAFGVNTVHAVQMKCQTALHDVKRLEMQLRALSPLAVLGRGYSVTSDDEGRIVRDAEKLKEGQRVVTRVEKGKFTSEVKSS